jgi:hypothetical protein
MRNIAFILTWAFIIGAAAYDGYFAWHYREVMEAWELNFVARRAAGAFGLPAVLGFKALTLLFGMAVAWYCRKRYRGLEHRLTAIIATAYLALSVYYVAGQLRNPIELPGNAVEFASHRVQPTISSSAPAIGITEPAPSVIPVLAPVPAVQVIPATPLPLPLDTPHPRHRSGRGGSAV